MTLLRCAFVNTGERQAQFKVDDGSYVMGNCAVVNFGVSAVQAFGRVKLDLVNNAIVAGPLSSRPKTAMHVESAVSLFLEGNSLPRGLVLNANRTERLDWFEGAEAVRLVPSEKLIESLSETVGAVKPLRDRFDTALVSLLKKPSGSLSGDAASFQKFNSPDWMRELPEDWPQRLQ